MTPCYLICIELIIILGARGAGIIQALVPKQKVTTKSNALMEY